MPDTLDALRSAHERSGWTQAEAARRAGLRQSHLSRYLSGKDRMSPKTLEKLMRLYGLEVRPVVRYTGAEGAD